MLGLQNPQTYIYNMKKIKEMIESASTKSEAIGMLNTYLIYSDITIQQYDKGRKLITNEFKK